MLGEMTSNIYQPNYPKKKSKILFHNIVNTFNEPSA